MPNIYLATLKDFTSNENQFNEEKYNFLAIKKHNYKLQIIRRKTPFTADFIANYDPSDKYLLFFKIDEHQSLGFKAYLDSKVEEFSKKSNYINKESISEFFKFLEADELYNFEALPSNEELNEASASIKLPEPLNKEIIASPQNLQDTERGSSPRSRSSSLSEGKTETESLRSANSLPKLSVENSNIKSIESSFSSLKSLENESPKSYSDQFVNTEKLCTFFTRNSNSDPFHNIKNHGEKIKKGYFNGKEKSEILLSISNLAKKIKVNSLNLGQQFTPENINELKEDILTLDRFINDQANLEKLSRYRGFSPFKCFATLWGGGKVTSMEYVNQLQSELNPLIDEVVSNRPAI